MTRRQGMLMAGAAGLIGLAGGAVGTRALAEQAGAPVANRAAIEAIVHDYILAHPEIIPEAMQKLQSRENAKAIDADRAALEKPFGSAWAGSQSPKITLVMFSDYSCGYCRASVGDVARLLAENPDLKVVWREIPVLGPDSVSAARVALAAAKQGRYLPLHKGLFAAGRPDAATIAKVAAAAGLDAGQLARAGKSEDVTAEIASNMALAGRLGVSGTPAFVIGGEFFSGAVGYEALAKAVVDARKS
ncbi:DsbA family protein [Sphingomonas sp. BIUV-7]|uniref:DsbA family protein n=1 Tax=Sphingomonas natans TaxID=3063330 RepID=A0ABT8Y5M7_9SPHN|nr:DsbA family protein [Sphingomonas sp. BIUV-7]MDO6413619.1 DsbA family protein [Sphingomonas sp. BIUV-7]